jgi:hypothetical protein
MFGRKDYTAQEVAQAKTAVAQQLTTFKKLNKLAATASTDKKSSATVGEIETVYFNNMVIVLDRYFVHRLRMVTGKDGNPINEVELIADSLMNNAGVFRGNNVVKYVPEAAVVKLRAGDTIKLGAADFERLSAAFFDDLERKFL